MWHGSPLSGSCLKLLYRLSGSFPVVSEQQSGEVAQWRITGYEKILIKHKVQNISDSNKYGL